MSRFCQLVAVHALQKLRLRKMSAGRLALIPFILTDTKAVCTMHFDTGMSTDHRKLSAFTLADEFAIRVYTATRGFPVEERYGLRSQIRRAAVSAPTNMVEGCARDSAREKARFFEIAFGSVREAIYLIDLAGRLELLDRPMAFELAMFGGRVAAGLAALRRTLT